MNDKQTTVAEIKQMIEDMVHERDWVKFHTPKDLAIKTAVEAAELLEIFEWQDTKTPEELKKDTKRMEKIKEELADVIVVSLSMANRLDMDVSQAIEKKIEENKKKYPIEKAKGSNKKYTEL